MVTFLLASLNGEPAALISDAIQVVGWLLNLSVAEWIIRRKPRRSASPALKLQTA